MADAGKIGTPWTDAGLDVIVADYFTMLGHEVAGRPYVKAHPGAAVIEVDRVEQCHRRHEK